MNALFDSARCTRTAIEVPGFRFATAAAGIKKTGALDVGIIVASRPVHAAAVFTRNLVRAAPVELAARRVKRGKAQAVLVNSGNANACTGAPGVLAAEESTRALALALGISEHSVLPASTGVIGALLPSEKIAAVCPQLAAMLDSRRASDFAEAIRTTDQWPKVASIQAGEHAPFSVLGIAKGAGMIHPDMATTLGFVLTDAQVSPQFLRKALRRAVDETFNAISVDGDTSTNDTIVLLASGEGPKLDGKPALMRVFEEHLRAVLFELGKSIVRDGEGAKHVAHIEVRGTSRDSDARKIARTIATSPLVKTALHGQDANWGRILAAAGRAGVRFSPKRTRIDIVSSARVAVRIVENGMPVGAEAERAAKNILAEPEYAIEVAVGAGKGRASYLTCDLGSEYIAVNANYRT